MSFILDALRKSENERQRASVPSLAQVPLATPAPQLPRWAVAVIVALAAALLVLGGAWWQSLRNTPTAGANPAPIVERSVALPPPPTATADAAPPSVPRPLPGAGNPFEARREPPSTAPSASSLAAEAGRASEPPPSERDAVRIIELGNRPADAPLVATPQLDLPADAPALPSAAALAAEGVSLPPLRLELHAYGATPRERFVFINGRKYVEGERLVEGPQLVSIEATGAVLVQSGRRFLLRQE